MDVVGVCDVVDNECPRYELFIVSVVAMIAMGMVVVSVITMGFVVLGCSTVIAIAAVVCIRIAMFSAVSVGIVLGMLGVCVVLISMAMVLSQKRCS
jgi:hypothetical protein